MTINKQDTNGVKPLLGTGELGYDNYLAGGDTGRVYVGNGAANIALGKKSEIDTVSTAVSTHTSRVDNPHSVTKAQVGLGNVDNTSDVNKPVSTATQTALDTKQATLISGTNIKTIEGVSLLGSGNIDLDKTSVGLGNVDNTADSTKVVASAAKLTTARTIGGVSFDGTANISLPGVDTAGSQNTTGSAAKLTTARTINGVSFDGTANITIADNTKAPLESPALTGTPIAPTAAAWTNNTQIATTEFVQRNFNVIDSSNSIDFNTITDAGLYERAIQGISPNGMGGNDYYYIVVYRFSSETLVQVAYPYSTVIQNKKVWTRTRYVSTWGDWNLVSGGAISQVTTLSNPTKNVGATWQKLNYSNEQISTASNVCKYLTGSGNFYIEKRGTYELTAQICPSPAQNTNAKISLYLGLFDLGTNGAGDTLISVANEEFPSGQHPSVSLSRVVEVTTDNRYFAFKWYFLDGGGVTPDMTLQTSSIYTYANIKKI